MKYLCPRDFRRGEMEEKMKKSKKKGKNSLTEKGEDGNINER